MRCQRFRITTRTPAHIAGLNQSVLLVSLHFLLVSRMQYLSKCNIQSWLSLIRFCFHEGFQILHYFNLPQEVFVYYFERVYFPLFDCPTQNLILISTFTFTLLLSCYYQRIAGSWERVLFLECHQKRTDRDFRQLKESNQRSESPFVRLRGYSFDCIFSVAIDVMHMLHEGVSKRIIKFMVSGDTHSSHSYYVEINSV